ncbi:hypothetical protein Droror1_Dr00026921 [Drosera rotundifolia]
MLSITTTVVSTHLIGRQYCERRKSRKRRHQQLHHQENWSAAVGSFFAVAGEPSENGQQRRGESEVEGDGGVWWFSAVELGLVLRCGLVLTTAAGCFSVVVGWR